MDTQITKRPDIKLCACESSQIHAFGYDDATQTLALQFKSKGGPGAVYHYPCAPDVYKQFCTAESKGKFFGSRIKGNPDMPHTRIEIEKDTAQ